jgi:hypothetical protein
MALATLKKTDLGSITRQLEDRGWELNLSEQSIRNIAGAGFRSKNLLFAIVASQIAMEQHPITLRGLFYQLVSAGWLPSTDKKHYDRTKLVMKTLRESKIVPFSWLVDNLRATDKPSSWSGLEDFAETVRDAYRKDFWGRMPSYVHIICEKDAIAGVLQPITRQYDVRLSPIRGYASISFAAEIADIWNRITKPIFAFYLGDFDPSGFDLERDIREKLTRYCKHPFIWTRLAVNREDFATFDLIPLEAKKKDRRYAKFVAEHGAECAEMDAIPADELRQRVERSILHHVDQTKWERLQRTEQLEKETLASIVWPKEKQP